MADFSIKYDANTRPNVISAFSNTTWECRVSGNFTLSKYRGEGNADIEILAPIEFPVVSGSIIFSYGSERCDMPSLDVYFPNDCYIETDPPIADDGFIHLYQKKTNEGLVISTYNLGGWSISGIVDQLIVYSDGQDFVLFPDLEPRDPLDPDCDMCLVITYLTHNECDKSIPIIIKKC